ncbi:hypothetical protein HN807_12085 [Candidatus Bathyarchaeota archaeon]|jgi:hypothetical protein|nr:hypothetical protein [Candidatus Bathyarchaeota archaeon]MBT4319820.1 hypothetical protein [Candidatus Bathyarchaeota archaeon]MBT4425193.1 hypothetical protein [Candidatus Bathyarchaeota archaeon]MBT5642684.1 hypothetical protein [Candidatus Bathyarchaeota archaeon]MBT6605607.1 hypothetical protein [Candidatus Bathyarchaeota archaeon]
MSSPYDFRRITPSVYGDKRPVEGEVVAVLHVMFEDRGLEFIQTKSRTVKLNEIHELMITDEQDAAPGGGADRVRAIGFFEITKSGLIVMGDKVTVNGKKLGTLAGYDVTHMPNHINVVVKTETLDDPDIRVGDRVSFS